MNLLTTECKSCHRKTPIRPSNSSYYWYCRHCKARVIPRPLSEGEGKWPKDVKEKIQKNYGQASHYIDLFGEVQRGGPVVIEVATLSKHTDHVPARPLSRSVLLLAHAHESQHDDFKSLGEVFY